MAANLQHQHNVDVGFGAIMLLMAAMLVAGVTTGAPLPEYLRIIGLVVAAVTAGFGLGAIASSRQTQPQAIRRKDGR